MAERSINDVAIMALGEIECLDLLVKNDSNSYYEIHHVKDDFQYACYALIRRAREIKARIKEANDALKKTQEAANADKSQISDGYHTFAELYGHRGALFIAMMKSNPALAWFSMQHDDGTMYPDYFIVGMNLPAGAATYHIHQNHWDLAVASGATELERAPKWDGHTSEDVMARINEFTRSSKPEAKAK